VAKYKKNMKHLY